MGEDGHTLTCADIKQRIFDRSMFREEFIEAPSKNMDVVIRTRIFYSRYQGAAGSGCRGTSRTILGKARRIEACVVLGHHHGVDAKPSVKPGNIRKRPLPIIRPS